MSVNILDFEEYKPYLAEKLTKEAENDRSYRSKLTEYVRCQSSYISQVLNGKPDFTLEQALRVSEFLKHDEVEAHYFILLVEKSRAGTVELSEFFNKRIKDIKKKQFDLKKRLSTTGKVREEDQHKYYSSWIYSAIYVMISIPAQNAETISKRLLLPQDMVQDALTFLVESGLIEKDEDTYKQTKKLLHLDRNSPFIHMHHINWRSQALQSVEKNFPTDLHYSTVVTLSKEDVEKVKEVYTQAINNARNIMIPSKEEEIIAITLDVFKL